MSDAIDTSNIRWAEIERHSTVLSDNQYHDEHARNSQSNRGMRETIGSWLITLLCVIVSLIFVCWIIGIKSENPKENLAYLKQIIDVVLSPVLTLLSSVIGFYFGSQLNSPKK